MAKYENLTSLFTNIADAIREKTGGTATIVADDFPDAIRAISPSENLDVEIQEQKEKIAELESILAEKAAVAGRNDLINVSIQGSSGQSGRAFYINESYVWIQLEWSDEDIHNVQAIGGMIFCFGDDVFNEVENGVIIRCDSFGPTDIINPEMKIAICKNNGFVRISGDAKETEIPLPD